ncbi:helix-turn-helix domain-containing protein [Maricaulis sp.]|uniref:helix-turn-helix domain-containing protein n=1 Tax=Maricaulis sp. TaxID=1486257 RepID=UPI00260BAD1F|nr:helix-turn-helix domain-containing protein [Maricaulis sp.]
MADWAEIHNGIETLEAGLALPRHRHTAPYAAIILAGGYVEAGATGRVTVEPGDVVVHPRYATHGDQIGTKGARTLNLALPEDAGEGVYRIEAAIDRVVQLALNGAAEACGELVNALARAEIRADAYMSDWPDQLAAALEADPSLALQDWARAAGLSAESVSRGFKRAFGVSPKAFRADAKARLAFRQLQSARRPLAEVALISGFADQAHMSRAINAMTGRSPSAWRRSSGYKTRRSAST